MAVVYLHVGEPKSGTTFLQTVMWGNRDALASQGLLLPGIRAQDHYRAAQDLRGVPQSPSDPAGSYEGEWEVLANQALQAQHAAVISNELLAAATAAQVARAMRSLAGAEVHIVLTVRDFASLLPAEWQETVKHRNTRTWQQWVRRIIATDGTERPGPWFWRVHDTLGVLRRWSAAVPAERVHVITVPPSGSPSDLLWRRFASVIGADSARADLSVARSNPSLGWAETELLRRLNVAIPRADVPDWFYLVQVKELIAHRVLAGRPAAQRPRLRARQAAWAGRRAERVAAALRTSGYQLVGALDDLLPAEDVSREPGAATAPRHGLAADAVLDAAVAVLAELVRDEYEPERRKRALEVAHSSGAARLMGNARAKRFVRNLSTRSAAVRRLRIIVWRWSERSRARHRNGVRDR